ncbi:MAG: bifunctional phosphoribosylaminoimidazolecarboxamide formyltransferase/IMP cyclohydrolase [Bacteroidia bacterium]|nr:bifunctional phosphoribosylaminoimidazolecarboxamide formyltransferase/IMP cyclohydrolase [Bacteroidia bacterium]
MSQAKKISNALISVFYKDGLEPVVRRLHELGVIIHSTGGTQDFIEQLGIPVVAVEKVTGYPSILGGRVKTLHPKVFGGILARRENAQDMQEAAQYEIPMLDLVIVDLYPFEETVKNTSDEQTIIEKIDIGGVSLIRAAAKNFADTLIVAHKSSYTDLLNLLNTKNGFSDKPDRKQFAAKAFNITSHYDTRIFNWFNGGSKHEFKQSYLNGTTLRYGENPHQQAVFFGEMNEVFSQLHGKELSYNNLVDADAASELVAEFTQPAFAIIKHTNPCGLAQRDTLKQAWKDALAGDPVSAFGGVITCNRNIDKETAQEMDSLFFEVLLAPGYDDGALEILKSKKNRILLVQKPYAKSKLQYKSLLNGVLVQDKDEVSETADMLKPATQKNATVQETADMLFAVRIVKHAKSNTIVLAKNGQLVGIGCGHTSRIDALHHAINKAGEFGLDLHGAVMASDAFFPFPDCVEVAHKAGITAITQPGGSIKDQLSIDYCNANGLAMVFTGIRHFKH